MQADPTDVVDAPDPGAVIRFLSANPEFFTQHEHILPRLRIPHVSGRAVSLIEHQVSVLRGKCTTLETSLRDLIGVARDNEALQHRLHQLVQEIISAPTLAAVVAATRRSLCSHFGADDVHVLLFEPDAAVRACADERRDDAALTIAAGAAGVESIPMATGPARAGMNAEGVDVLDGPREEPREGPGEGRYRTISRNSPALAHVEGMFDAGGTRCGVPETELLALLVGDDAASPGSAAIIPLQYQGALGLVMLASRDESRFGADKGVVFLNQLGDVLGRRVHALARDES